MSEEKQDAVCPCGATVCEGGYGWQWHSQDLGNTHRVGGTSYKAGQLWAEVCPQWVGDEEPPAPPDQIQTRRKIRRIQLRRDENEQGL